MNFVYNNTDCNSCYIFYLFGRLRLSNLLLTPKAGAFSIENAPAFGLVFGWLFLVTVIGVLLATALLTLLERKIMASVQRRRGPNVVGFFGLLQPFADGLKLALKETTVPRVAQKPLFVAGPVLAFGLAVFGWSLLPFPTWLPQPFFVEQATSNIIPASAAIDFDIGLLFLFVVVALHVYGVLLGGWASNSRYALLGALRATAQSISYELTFGFVLLIFSLCHSGFALTTMVFDQLSVWNFFSLFPVAIVFVICSLAELNRTPFDLVEAEGELVAGYNVEYSAMMFALYFLAEYVSIIYSAFVVVLLFFGGWIVPKTLLLAFFLVPSVLFNGVTASSGYVFALSVLTLVCKVSLIVIFSLMVRFVLPRYRYDQLMSIGWLVFLPICLLFLLFYAILVLLN